MVPKEIIEAEEKISKWMYYSLEDDKDYLDENAPEEIKKLKKKADDWWEKNPILMD